MEIETYFWSEHFLFSDASRCLGLRGGTGNGHTPDVLKFKVPIANLQALGH